MSKIMRNWERQQQVGSLQRRGVSCGRRNPSKSSQPRTKENFSHQPAIIPSWEREFCSKIGLFTWKRFTEAKSYVHLYRDILGWNDSAAEEAFYNAKNRFKATFHRLPCNILLPKPDMFIDEVDWDSEIDPGQLSGLQGETDDEEEENENGTHQGEANNIPLTDIVPTGWDIDVTEYSGPKVLTGLIVG